MPKIIRTAPNGQEAKDLIKKFIPEEYQVVFRNDLVFTGWEISNNRDSLGTRIYIMPDFLSMKVMGCTDLELPAWILDLARAIEERRREEVTITWD